MLMFPALSGVLLAACGGGDSGRQTQAPPARGTLLQSAPQLLATVTSPELLLQVNAGANQTLASLGVAPICDVLMYSIEYETVGGAGEATTASAALMVPTGLGSRCTGKRPIVLYAHGTTTDRAFTMTNLQNAETISLALLFASQGDIVVAPNYAGYDTSNLPYHPYLVADQQSKDMIDGLTAARSALPLASLTLTQDNGQLFITGYSQGGYVAMATHRAMQTAGLTVTASAPMSGPYALAAFVDAVFDGEVDGGATVSSALLLTAYQHAYGNIYGDPATVFAPAYAAGIDALLPSTAPRSVLYAEGKLPEYALFSATPPSAAYADITPATSPASLAFVFALGFGTGNLIQNSYRLAYLQDPVESPQLPWRVALKANDLRTWVPTAPVLLCGGAADPVVFWMNAQLMDAYWTAQAPADASIGVLDLESAAVPGDPYGSFKTGFVLAKDLVIASAIAQGATDGGAAAQAEVYHTGLVAPFCFAAARSFFANY